MFTELKEHESSQYRSLKLSSMMRGSKDILQEKFIYDNDKSDRKKLDLVERMQLVPKCTILQSGLRITVEKVRFFFCSCDPNQIYQICVECAEKCHKSKGHILKEQSPAHIKCSCGEKLHNIDNSEGSHEYKVQCNFEELAQYSGINEYFQNELNENICLFCDRFCSTRDVDLSNNEVRNKKMLTKSYEEVPPCECSHHNHTDNKNIYTFINTIGSNKDIELVKGFKRIQFINLLFKCKNSYENLYSDLNGDFNSTELIKKIQYIINHKKIHMTNFFLGLTNFTNLSKKIDGLRYYSAELLNLTPFTDLFIYSLLNSKFEDSVSFWTFLSYVFKGYKNITVGYHTKHIPKFKIFDLENMSSLQRLCLLNRTKDSYYGFLTRFFNANNYLTDLFIDAISKVASTRFTLIKAYDAINSIISILHNNSSFYLFSTSQMIKFCNEVDKLFESFSLFRIKPKYSQFNSTINKNEGRLFSKIVKILHMFIYIYNDHIVLKALNSDIEMNYENIKFLHDKTELGRSIFRINMKILHVISTEYTKDKQEHFPLFNKIMRHGAQILNLIANNTDTYVISLKRNFYYTENYLEVLRSEKMSKEMSDGLEFLDKNTVEIESLYEQYLNLSKTKMSLCTQFGIILDRFFSLINYSELDSLPNPNPNPNQNNNQVNNNNINKSVNFSLIEGAATESPTKRVLLNRSSRNVTANFGNYDKVNNQNAQSSPDIKLISNMRKLFYHSNFFFTVVKFFRIVDLDPESDRQLINKIFSFVWLFVEENSDNALVVLSSNIFNSLKRLHYTYAYKNFELFLHCVTLISQKDEYGFTKHLIKKISNYLFKLPYSYEDKYVCLDYNLKILDIVLHDVKSLNFNLTILKMKSILKNIYAKYNILEDFIKFLIGVTKDVLDERYSYSNVEEYDGKIEEHELINNKIIFKLSENERNTSNCNISISNPLVFNIFYLMLKITNKIFDSSNLEDRKFLNNIFKKEHLIYILKNKSLNLNIRTEIIKFYRKSNLDIYASESQESVDFYIRAFINQMDDSQSKRTSLNNFPLDLYSFYEELIKVSDNVSNYNYNNSNKDQIKANPYINKFDSLDYEFISHEVKFYKQNFESGTKIVNSTVLNYIEQGLILPISLYLKKVFSTITNLSGEEFLSVYYLFPYILKLKKYFLEMNTKYKFLNTKKVDREEDEKLEKENMKINKNEQVVHKLMVSLIFHELKGYNTMPTFLASNAINEMNPDDVLKDLDRISSKKFPAFDYMASHAIIQNQLFTMLQKPKSVDLSETVKKVNEVAELKVFEESENLFVKCSTSKERIKLYKLSYLYQIRKGNLNDDVSLFGQGLHEVCIEYETTYGNLLLKYLNFVLTTDSHYLNAHFSVNSYSTLFKLLQYYTGDIQSELERILHNEQNTNQEMDSKIESIEINKSILSRQNSEDDDDDDDVIEIIDESVKLNEIIIYIPDKTLGFMNSFASLLFKKLIKIFVTDFNPRDYIYNTDYLEAFNIIKIFKFMCEEHNNFFQGNMIKNLNFSYNYHFDSNLNKIISDKITFFDLLLLVIHNILIWSNWDKRESNEDYNLDYFFDIFSAIIELLIEIIQGNTSENLAFITVNKVHEENLAANLPTDPDQKQKEKISKSAIQQIVEVINKGLLFHDGESDPILYDVRTHLMTLLLTILEEKNCSSELKKFIVESLSVDKVLSSINNTLKKYFLSRTEEDQSWDDYKLKYFSKVPKQTRSQSQINLNIILSDKKSSHSRDYKMLKFDHELYTYFCDQYFVDNDHFPESPEFKFANTLYRYIKLISITPYEIEEANSLINKTNEIPKRDIINEIICYNKEALEDANTLLSASVRNPYSMVTNTQVSYEINFCEQYFTIKFFEEITQIVEVCTKEKENTTVIFTVMPNINYLSNDSKEAFLKNVNRENQFAKLYGLIDNVDFFKEEIEFNADRKSSKLYSTLKNFNYNLIQYFMYLFCFAINLLIIFVLKGDLRKIYDYTDGSTPEAAFEDLVPYENQKLDALVLYERQIIRDMISASINDWGSIYKGLTIAMMILCVFFIVCYLFTKVPLLYKIELKKYLEKNQISRNGISRRTKIKILISNVIIGKDQISLLIFFLVTGIIAVTNDSRNTEIFYSLGLIMILNINPTLKNISIAVKLKYKELLSTLLLIFILYYAHSNIGFFFFKKRFVKTLWEKLDNYCESLMFCFLTHSNAGFRIEGGIGDVILDKYSFERDPGTYAGRFIYDFFYFCVMNIIMRELAFGIIIETFHELRKEEQHSVHDAEFICFICGAKKDELEKKRIDFNQHREKDHCIWNYINYMIRLKFSDPQDLNAINSYILEQFDKKYTNWFPIETNQKVYEKINEKEKIDDFDLDLDLDFDKYNQNTNHQIYPINKN